MKKIIYFFAFFISVGLFAQKSDKQPLVLIDGMLASNALIKNDEKNIQKKDVYKTAANLPQNLKSFEKLAANGLISVNVKELYYDRISLENLNSDFNLAAGNPVYFDGNQIEDTKLMVITNDLANMQVEVINGQKYLSLSSVPVAPSANAIK